MRRFLATMICAGALALAAATGAAQQAPTDRPAEQEQKITRTWAVAQFGEPLYGPDMHHWRYANPDAPKGGSITLGAFGTFDSLNTYILRGQWPAGIGLVTDSLMTGSADELASAYGLIAESVEYPEDKSWAIFTIRPEARWHDGQPITADDFVYAHQVIRHHGRPFLQSFYQDVETVEALEPRRLKFSFKTRDTMKPLVTVAGSAPLPRHWWSAEGRDITKTTLEPVLGSGPYRIKAIDPGRSITYERIADYWAKDLPVNRGLNNIDQIRYDYYLDDNVLFEAFLSGRIDFRAENKAQRWATQYDTPDVRQGRIVKRETPNRSPRGTYGYVFNLRRPQFQDVRVRKALNYLYDFESVRKSLLYGQYARIKSWFPNSEYGASGPPGAEELAILEPYRDRLAPEVLTQAFEPPQTDGTGPSRQNIREAMGLFKQAGWAARGGRLVNARGEPFRLEFLLSNATLVRVTEPYVQTLQRAGIDASIRVADTSQYQVRTDQYDYDAVVLGLNFFAPPGTELRSFFHSKVADIQGQGNFAAIRDPVVDDLIERIVQGRDLPAIEASTRALDRVLLWGWYQVPLWYNNVNWLAYWNKFGYPETMAKYSNGFPATWWLTQVPDRS